MTIEIIEYLTKACLDKKFSKVLINTIDNPGWGLTIVLNNLYLKQFSDVDVDRSEKDWFFCRLANNSFEGDGGLFNLEEIFLTFMNYMNEKFNDILLGKDFEWLMKWYANECNGDWEHCYGIKIGTIDSGWFLKIGLVDTELENKIFEKIATNNTDQDWVKCYIENNVFYGYGGPLNLGEILQIFRKWAENTIRQLEF